MLQIRLDMTTAVIRHHQFPPLMIRKGLRGVSLDHRLQPRLNRKHLTELARLIITTITDKVKPCFTSTWVQEFHLSLSTIQ